MCGWISDTDCVLSASWPLSSEVPLKRADYLGDGVKQKRRIRLDIVISTLVKPVVFADDSLEVVSAVLSKGRPS